MSNPNPYQPKPGKTVGDNLTLSLTLNLTLTLSLTLNLTLSLTLNLTLNVTVTGSGRLPPFCPQTLVLT